MYFKGTSKPTQTKRTLNKILRFEGSGLWLRKREKGYLFIVLTISVTIELFPYTALQRLKINFSLYPRKVQQAWDDNSAPFAKVACVLWKDLKTIQKNTPSFHMMQIMTPVKDGKEWEPGWKTMKTHDPRPKATMLREYNLGFST